VHVNEPGRNDKPGRVDFALRRPVRHTAYGDNPISGDRYVADEPRIAGAIHNPAAAKDKVELRLLTSKR
jgi:hypothetical protein